MRNAGLTDLQANGYAGVDFNSTAITADAMDHALHAMLLSGVTACLPTLITAREDELAARLAALDRAVGGCRLGPLMVPGYHLEGPFLSPLPGYAGCHPAAAMVAPDSALLERLGHIAARPIAMLTLAPERDGAIPVIAWAKARGIVVALGHTAADAAAIDQAVAAGAALSTHLGNALPQPQPKFLNPMMAQLAEDGLSASFIADGIHIPRHVLKVLVRAKGLARCVLVTDATAAAAAPPGLYDFAGMTIEHTPDGSVRVPGGQVLAGSALCLDQAVRNAVAWDLADTATALAMASSHPDALLGGHQRRPPSTDVVWSGTLHPERVSIGGLVIKPGGSETP
jgi:N-acetylglucosamine-6-phosphate deacetylase